MRNEAWLSGRRIFVPMLLLACVALAATAAAAQAQELTADGDASSLDSRVESAAKTVTLYLARFVEMAAALVIGVASVRALWSYFANLGGKIVPKDEIRLSLGKSLALALEFALGADILKTAVAPTWDEIGQLAAIAVLRTALNYFLERELKGAEARPPENTSASSSG